MSKTIAVIGKNGQLAWELSLLDTEDKLVFFGRNDIDITSPKSLNLTLSKGKYDAVINASAYTAVDKAESDQENAFLINSTAVRNLVQFCCDNEIHFTHVSTDYVFGGDKGSPYIASDPYNPQGVYGESKMEGEKAIKSLLPKGSCIIRTSWVYSSHGTNFVKTMLRLMDEKEQLGVIDDQIGSPTYAKGLAQAVLHAAVHGITGTYHWTDEGVCSWFDFAHTIQELGIKYNLLQKPLVINPIPTSEFPTPASRPSYSVLNKLNTRDKFSKLKFTHWKDSLEQCIQHIKSGI